VSKEVEMARHLVLLEQGLEDETSIDELRDMAGDGDLHLIVPTTPLSEQEKEFIEVEGVHASMHEGDEAATMANWRLRKATTALEEAGLEGRVDGQVGRADPIDAVEDALSTGDYDRVVIVTSRPGIAGWLHLDTASKIERRVDVPVAQLHAEVKHKS
jgi:hypothetical protein